MTDTTQPPAETLEGVMAQAALIIGNVPVSAMVGRCGWKKHSEALEGMRAILAALTGRAGGDAIPAGEGEPVAWRWERRGRFGPEIGAWEQVFTPYPPDKWPEDDRRNIVPLYATPKPPAGGDAGAVRWRERWYGSDPQRGSAIVDEAGNLIAYFGGNEETHRATTAAVAAHNAALALPAPVVEGDRGASSSKGNGNGR